MNEEKWIFKREDLHPTDFRWEEYFDKFVPYYDDKYLKCKRFNPKRILEIGVRFGYSALAFLNACPDAEYVGLDLNQVVTYSDGKKLGPFFEDVRKTLSQFNVTLHQMNTMSTRQIDFGNFDFVHIDGDHSYSAVYNDMRITYPHINTGGIMLIDDYDYPEVKKAVDQFVKENNLTTEYTKTWTGELVIFKKD